MGLSMRGRAAATSAGRTGHSDSLRRGIGMSGVNGRGTVAQRVRVGLTGLAAIFLAVLIAAAGMRPVRSWQPSGAPGEPLAVLGVAPGAGSADAAPAPATADLPAPASAPVDTPAPPPTRG